MTSTSLSVTTPPRCPSPHKSKKHKNPVVGNLCLLYFLFSYYKESIIVLSQAALDEVDDELCRALDAQQTGVQAQVVTLGVAPQFVGVEVVVLGAQFVGLVGTFLGRLAGVTVAALHDAPDAVIDGGVQEHADDGAVVTQHIVGCAANDHTGFAVYQVFHHLALGLVDVVVGHCRFARKG